MPWGGGTQDNWDYRMSAFLHTIDVMRYVGADVLWQDAGWHDQLGDNDGPDFAQVKGLLSKSGMGLAVWWPLYSVSDKSRVFRHHPEWLADPAGVGGSHLDTSKKEVNRLSAGRAKKGKQHFGEIFSGGSTTPQWFQWIRMRHPCWLSITISWVCGRTFAGAILILPLIFAREAET